MTFTVCPPRFDTATVGNDDTAATNGNELQMLSAIFVKA
jgi:hypothetical protein